jgi:site-specific DNA-methyltransferase (adenine-specific)
VTVLPRNTILTGDALTRLRELPTASVDCAVTSPPYYLLRSYGVAGQLGLEPTVEAWVTNLRVVFAEVARVLKPSGSLWLNLGDSFSRHPRYGAPAKSLFAAPERLLLALVADGWMVRNKVVWAKANAMPSSVADRLTATHDVVYFLVRSGAYYFDLDAIREPHCPSQARTGRRPLGKPPAWAGPHFGSQDGLRRARPAGVPGHWLGKNPGDVWRIYNPGYHGAHVATFPEALVRRPLLATCPERICTACGAPWRRPVTVRRLGRTGPPQRDDYLMRFASHWHTVRQVGPLVPCGCGAPARPGVVLDPFFGSGTVGVVAEQLGRDWLGIELNPDYVALAQARLARARRGPVAEAA